MLTKKNNTFFTVIFVSFVAIFSCNSQSKFENEALKKIDQLTEMMADAQSKSIDVTREETTLWFSKTFLKFANWDEANKDVIEGLFEKMNVFDKDKTQLAEELPDFERKKVIQMLNASIKVLGQEIRGEISRRPVAKVDWHNTKASENMFVGNGKPTFLYDYFSKTVGQPLTNKDVYNDHLGALFHGGENLYPVDHDRAINSFLLKEDGTFDQELMKELTEIPDTNIGYLIYWNMGIPKWAEKREPEIRKGRSLFNGFDIDNPLARDIWGKIVRETGRLTKGKKVTELGYIFSNEPHWFTEKNHWTHRYEEMNELSSYTKNKFRDWLKKKYNRNIKVLNRNWESSFDDFGAIDIEIPISQALRGKPIWYDWCRYNMDRTIDWFSYIQNELHAVNPDADTHIKLWPPTFYEDSRSHGMDFEALTELTTMIGHDAKSLGAASIRAHINSDWNKKYAFKWSGMAILHDFLESVGPNKINVNSESHFLSSGQYRELDPRTSYVRSVYWLATLMGMDANMGWFWARDPDGSPEDRLEGELNFFDPGLAPSFAASNNMQPHVTNEVTQVMMDLNAFSEEIVALREQKRPLRLFYSETSAINTSNYMTKMLTLYKSLFFEGIPLGFATKNIIDKQDNSNWSTIVVNNNTYVTDAEFKSLQRYLDNGGTIIVDTAESLSLDEYGKKRKNKLAKSKGKLVILEEFSFEKMRKIALKSVESDLPDVVVRSDNGGNDFKTIISRVVRKNDGTYLVNLLNVGHDSAKISLSLQDGRNVSIIDIMTSVEIDNHFDLSSEQVLLLEVKPL